MVIALPIENTLALKLYDFLLIIDSFALENILCCGTCGVITLSIKHITIAQKVNF